MRNYIVLLLLNMCVPATAMWRARVPIARPTRGTHGRPMPQRNYAEKCISQEQRIAHMVSAIKESSKKASGQAHFINSLENTLARQLKREQELARKIINYSTVNQLTDHQEILAQATIKYLNDLQSGKNKNS